MEKNEINVDVELKEEMALNGILTDTVKKDAETIRGLKQIIITLIIAFALTVFVGFGSFVLYESQFDYSTETDRDVSLDAEGENANVEYNDVAGSQYNDSSTHNEVVGK